MQININTLELTVKPVVVCLNKGTLNRVWLLYIVMDNNRNETPVIKVADQSFWTLLSFHDRHGYDHWRYHCETTRYVLLRLTYLHARGKTENSSL